MAAAKAKTTAKTTAERPSKRPQKHGGALNAGGTPGNKGGTGRPPNWLRDWCDELLSRQESKDAVEKILKDPDHPAFSTMWGRVADRAAGKPKETVEVTGEGGGPVKHQVWIVNGKEITF